MKRNYKIVLALVFLSVLGYCVIEANRAQDTRDFTRDTFGIAVQFAEPEVRHETSRSWQGDGYSFERYAVPQLLLQQFTDSADLMMGAYPKFPTFRQSWVCHSWRRTPVPPEDAKSIDTALGEAPPEAAAVARAALAAPGNWYARCVKGATFNVDLYLLDVARATFVLANSQM